MADEYSPSPEEFVATGVVGVLLYFSVLIFAFISVCRDIKSKSTKRFFFSMILMAVFEFPRYFAMAISKAYTSRTAYCFHIFGGIFFFIAFSIVCFQWSRLLQLGSYFRAVYSVRGLVASNIAFGIVDIVAVAACATSSSLESFFESDEFEAITFIEGVRNCVYSTFLAYYGVKLVRRFWHFSLIEKRALSASKGPNGGSWYFTQVGSSPGEQVFTKVVIRLNSVLIVASICFICRVCMLIAKMDALHADTRLTTPSFSLFGFFWFVFSDFIPRALPSLAFIALMGTKKPPRNQIKENSQHKEIDPSTHAGFPFSPVNDDDEPLGPYDVSFGDHSKTEIMMNSDQFMAEKKPLSPSRRGISDKEIQLNAKSSDNFLSNDLDPFYSDEDDDDDDDETIADTAIDKIFSLMNFTNHKGSSQTKQILQP